MDLGALESIPFEVSPCLRRSGYAQAGLKLSQPASLPSEDSQSSLDRVFDLSRKKRCLHDLTDS